MSPFTGPHPPALTAYLAAIHAGLLAGQIRAWWVPYLGKGEPERAARYAAMFGRTHRFLPERNGISPNALHVGLQLATVRVLVGLGVGQQRSWDNCSCRLFPDSPHDGAR